MPPSGLSPRLAPETDFQDVLARRPASLVRTSFAPRRDAAIAEGGVSAAISIVTHLIAQPWQEARPGVQVKLLAQEGELYVLAQSRDRVAKERAMRRSQLKRLWARLKQLSTMRLAREELPDETRRRARSVPHRLAPGNTLPLAARLRLVPRLGRNGRPRLRNPAEMRPHTVRHRAADP
jgi:hypothetical protein